MARFEAQVDGWVLKSRKRMEAIMKESAQRTFKKASDGVPVDTGFARASFVTSLNAPVNTVSYRPNAQGATYNLNEGAISATLAQADLGETIFGVWTANYVRFLEYGARGRSGLGFARRAAQSWPDTVSDVVREAKARFR